MSKKFLSLALAALLALTANAPAARAFQATSTHTAAADAVRDCAAKTNDPRGARVEVKLRDGSKLKGRLGRVADDHFVVVKDNTATPVPYDRVASVKCGGGGKSFLAEAGKGAAAVVLIAGAATFLGILVASQTK